MSPPEPIIVRVSDDLAPVVPEYLELTRRGLAAALDALAVEDFNVARTFGHNLKGSGSSFGMVELTRIGARIETAARQRLREDVRRDLEAVSAYLSRVQIEPA